MVVDNLEFHVKRTGDVGASGINNLSNSLGRLQKASDKAVKHTSKLLDSLKRIAMYRVLRTIIKEIGQAFSEGLKNVYQYSSTINGALSQTLDTLAGMTTQFKNSLGSALGELLMNIEPILTAILNLAIRVADAIAQLFAVLGGRSTYNKAVASAEKWEDAAKGGAAAAKEWKNQLMGFDEINRLNDQNSGGGGGGGSSGGKFEEAPAMNAWAEELRRITMDWWNSLNLEPIINAWNRLREAVSDFVSLVDSGLRWAYENVLLPLAGWTIEELAPALVTLLAAAFEWLNAVIQKLAPVFIDFYENHLKPFAKWVGEKLIKAIEWLTEKFEDMTQKVIEANSLSEFINSLDGAEVIILAVAVAIGIVALSLSPIKLIMIGVVAAGMLVYENWEKIKEGAANFREAMQPVVDAFNWVKEKIDAAIAAIQTFFAWLNSLNFVKSANARAAAAQADGSIYLQGFASGGYPNEGQLFVAREAGPELVGQIGGRTSVASNNDIVASVSDGVYRAVTEAMLTHGGSNGNQDIVIQIDGNTLARTMTKYQRFNTIAANA